MENEVRMRLLGEIIYQLQDGRRESNHLSSDMDYIRVHFHPHDRRRKEIGYLYLTKAMDALINNITNFGDFDISDADTVTLESN